MHPVGFGMSKKSVHEAGILLAGCKVKYSKKKLPYV